MKNKKQKKLVVLAAMGALLALVGVSGSQTYAKYIETKTIDSTQATVAKWGYVVTTDASNLFGTNYLIEGADSTELEADTLASLKVSKTKTATTVLAVMAGDNVVAPGTEGSMTVAVTGQSEVDAKLSFSYLTADIEEIHLGDYYPIVWTYTLTNNGTAVDTLSGKLSEVLEDLTLNELIYQAGTNVNVELSISWDWAFDKDPSSADNDRYDTMLGILANGSDSMQYSVSEIEAAFASRSIKTSFSFDVTLEQVQSAA